MDESLSIPEIIDNAGLVYFVFGLLTAPNVWWYFWRRRVGRVPAPDDPPWSGIGFLFAMLWHVHLFFVVLVWMGVGVKCGSNPNPGSEFGYVVGEERSAEG